jgi:hypothetical protein
MSDSFFESKKNGANLWRESLPKLPSRGKDPGDQIRGTATNEERDYQFKSTPCEKEE